jgi:nuclear pore complex protein Nup93
VQKFPLLPTAYHILAHLTQEPSIRDASSEGLDGAPVLERQYAGAYLGDPRSANAVLLRGRLTAGGRRFLERE